MSVIEIVSLACLFILFLIMFFVVKNHLVLMHLWRQRAVQNGAMMDVQDRENPALDTPLQPRADEMFPIGMHVIPHQRGVLESGGNYIGTSIGIQRMAMEPSTFFYQRIANRPLPRENDEELNSKKVREITHSVLHSFSPISLAALSSYSYSQFFRCKKMTYFIAR